MRILLFLAHFAMLLFSAYFYFNFDVRWVQVIGYNLAFNEPVANSLNHSINIYFKLIAITSFSYLFFAIFQRFCRSFALLLWMAKVGVFGKYLFALNALQSSAYDRHIPNLIGLYLFFMPIIVKSVILPLL